MPCSSSASSKSFRQPDKENKVPRQAEKSTGERKPFLPLHKIHRSVKIMWGLRKTQEDSDELLSALKEAGLKTRLSDLTSIIYPFLGPLSAARCVCKFVWALTPSTENTQV